MDPLTVAVLDSGGHLLSFQREDGSGILRSDIAIGKAWGALGMGIPSRTIRDRLKDRPAFQNALAVASQGRFIPVPGGVLACNQEGDVLGAVGISGDTSEKDEYCRNILKNKGFEFELRIHINEFWINKNYSRKHLLYKEIENKELFTNICDYGIHKYTEPHCIPEINKILKEYELQKNSKINLTVPIQ